MRSVEGMIPFIAENIILSLSDTFRFCKASSKKAEGITKSAYQHILQFH